MGPLFNEALWWHSDPVRSSCASWKRSKVRHSIHVVEDDKMWKLSCDLPGIKVNDLSVTSDGKNLHISASRFHSNSDGDSTSATVKRSLISESFPVDWRIVDLSEIKANLSAGVLIVSAPKKPKPDVLTIPITTNPHLEESATSIETGTEPARNDGDKLKDEFENVTLEEASPTNQDESDSITLKK
jgi:HSP20 family molecular chaperone IbpA